MRTIDVGLVVITCSRGPDCWSVLVVSVILSGAPEGAQSKDRAPCGQRFALS